MRIIDLRRDTITKPDHIMKQDAFTAPLGDSVYGEDPDQVKLERISAEKIGKEEAIFVPSGTMGNLTALLSHTRRGDEIITENSAHIRMSETGGAAALAGLMLSPVRGHDGLPEKEAFLQAVRKDDIHYPRTSLLCLETSHYRYGGIITDPARFAELRKEAAEGNIKIHLDGARLFNSSIALGIDCREITRFADSVMVSLSKGLGAPVGSILAGSGEFIEKAKRFRKMLGGGMRQTGWLARCGIAALADENIRRLAEDHRNARTFARGLNKIAGYTVEEEKVHTNIVFAYYEFSEAVLLDIIAACKEHGVLCNQPRNGVWRFAFCREVTGEDVETALNAIRRETSTRG